MSEVRRGSAAIQEAAKSSGGGGFRPFLPAHYWKGEEGEERYLLFLNAVEDMPLFDMIQYIPDHLHLGQDHPSLGGFNIDGRDQEYNIPV